MEGQCYIVASEAIRRLQGPSDLNKPGLSPPPGNGIWFLSPDRTLYVSVGYLENPEPNSTRNIQGGIFNHIISKINFDVYWTVCLLDINFFFSIYRREDFKILYFFFLYLFNNNKRSKKER